MDSSGINEKNKNRQDPNMPLRNMTEDLVFWSDQRVVSFYIFTNQSFISQLYCEMNLSSQRDVSLSSSQILYGFLHLQNTDTSKAYQYLQQ